MLTAALPASAEIYPAAGTRTSLLTIYSTTDTAVFETAIRHFQKLNPGVAVRYEELESNTLYEQFLSDLIQGQPKADLLLSSAMDLQVKLVNDGYAATHISANTRLLPVWARWRDQAFGFTFEPAVMVFNVKAFAGRRLPQTRGELIDLMRRDPATWRGRIGTYDIANSSVGYLLASQDARQSGEYGALLETMGDADVRIERHTSDLLARLEKGELAIGYNLLGPYAQSRIAAGAPLAIVYPRDYTLVVTRTAVLPASAPNPDGAHGFLEYLVSIEGQRTLANDGGLPAIRNEASARQNQGGIVSAAVGPLRPVVLGPGLLVYLDTLKKRRFMNFWDGAVTPQK
jgi:iron(III) transport system substrate-binding protein